VTGGRRDVRVVKESLGGGNRIVKRVNNGKDNAEARRAAGERRAHGVPRRQRRRHLQRRQRARGLCGGQPQGPGRHDYNAQLDPPVVPAQQKDQVQKQWDLEPVKNGIELGELAIAAAGDKPASEWQKTMVVGATLVDDANIGNWVPWDEQLKAVGAAGS
jgi:hypothetical protein